MSKARPCPGSATKECGRPAQNLSPYCGLHQPKEGERRSRDATAQWEGGRLRKANEAASDLVVNHRMSWCRARLFHALAGAHEQGVLVEVLEEMFADTVVGDAGDGGAFAVIAANMARRWPAGGDS